LETKKIEEVIEEFDFAGELTECIPYGNGHINDTYRLTFRVGEKVNRYILQRMNKSIFTDPVGLMENISGVTSWLKKKILENAARYVRPGGRLLYSTCTLEQDENTRMRKWFLENHPEFVSVPFSHPVTGESLEELQILPQRDGINGFYLCLFAKRK